MTAFAGVAELGEALRAKRVSAVELAHETLDRLEKNGPRYNAVASLLRARALREAAAADRALSRGDAGSPLLGIPYGAKDLLAARGAPTTWGAAPYRKQVFRADATAVAKLRRAGAVLAAKLAMVELAGGGGYRYASASLQGPGRNPWDTSRWTGGSSSGSGAAVAAGLVPFALGSETSGSIGTPSAYCGVTGLRPTYGLVSRHGAMALSWTLDKIGPLARSASDCAVVLAAIAGPDAHDATTSGKRFRPLDAEAARERVESARIGYAGEEIVELASPAARDALLRGVEELRRIVPRFVDARLPEDLPYAAMAGTVIGAESATIFAELIEGDRLDEMPDARQKAGFRAALRITARDYLQAMRLRSVLIARTREIFRDCDVILSAGRTATATPIEQALDAATLPPGASAARDAAAVPARRRGNVGLIPAGNLAGLPAIFFPCGLGSDGLPVGLQLVGPPFSEPLLVAIVEAYQRETEHHRARPASA
ncbi:MAG: amidase [Chloroflexota bacterium]|nr:amidase [Chloroflexota bacterium]MDE3194348.1 amidase [Chloroflexota bacterium]